MAKHYKLIDLPHTSPDNSVIIPIDWAKCVLCQVETKEAIRCPAKSLLANKELEYRTLAENLLAFNQIGRMPMDINIHRLNDGQGIAETLISRSAAWHVSCFGEVNKQKVDRALKRKMKVESSERESSPVKCFVCDQAEDETHALHKAQTFLLNKKVTQCATDLKDTKLYWLSCRKVI